MRHCWRAHHRDGLPAQPVGNLSACSGRRSRHLGTPCAVLRGIFRHRPGSLRHPWRGLLALRERALQPGAGAREGRLIHQPFPGAADGIPEASGRGHKDVDLPGFDLLEGAQGNFCSFGGLLLREAPLHPFPAQIIPEAFQLGL